MSERDVGILVRVVLRGCVREIGYASNWAF